MYCYVQNKGCTHPIDPVKTHHKKRRKIIIPIEIVNVILQFIDTPTLIQCSTVSKSWINTQVITTARFQQKAEKTKQLTLANFKNGKFVEEPASLEDWEQFNASEALSPKLVKAVVSQYVKCLAPYLLICQSGPHIVTVLRNKIRCWEYNEKDDSVEVAKEFNFDDKWGYLLTLQATANHIILKCRHTEEGDHVVAIHKTTHRVQSLTALIAPSEQYCNWTQNSPEFDPMNPTDYIRYNLNPENYNPLQVATSEELCAIVAMDTGLHIFREQDDDQNTFSLNSFTVFSERRNTYLVRLHLSSEKAFVSSSNRIKVIDLKAIQLITTLYHTFDNLYDLKFSETALMVRTFQHNPVSQENNFYTMLRFDCCELKRGVWEWLKETFLPKM